MVTILLNFVSPPNEEYEAGLLRSQLFDTMPLEGGTMLTRKLQKMWWRFSSSIRDNFYASIAIHV